MSACNLKLLVKTFVLFLIKTTLLIVPVFKEASSRYFELKLKMIHITFLFLDQPQDDILIWNRCQQLVSADYNSIIEFGAHF